MIEYLHDDLQGLITSNQRILLLFNPKDDQ